MLLLMDVDGLVVFYNVVMIIFISYKCFSVTAQNFNQSNNEFVYETTAVVSRRTTLSLHFSQLT